MNSGWKSSMRRLSYIRCELRINLQNVAPVDLYSKPVKPVQLLHFGLKKLSPILQPLERLEILTQVMSNENKWLC